MWGRTAPVGGGGGGRACGLGQGCPTAGLGLEGPGLPHGALRGPRHPTRVVGPGYRGLPHRGAGPLGVRAAPQELHGPGLPHKGPSGHGLPPPEAAGPGHSGRPHGGAGPGAGVGGNPVPPRGSGNTEGRPAWSRGAWAVPPTRGGGPSARHLPPPPPPSARPRRFAAAPVAPAPSPAGGGGGGKGRGGGGGSLDPPGLPPRPRALCRRLPALHVPAAPATTRLLREGCRVTARPGSKHTHPPHAHSAGPPPLL